ncbi:hypothetical protein CASFOL_041540 [Castilleja foliolosa]|uniref:Reverse transcriptase domain-containing protein n=1 Tax=Castilleja foliolosa TaxID=1961234 RepID=A0ABD3BB01_9LAMI
MATSRAIIDVQQGRITLRVYDQSVTFVLRDLMNTPSPLLDAGYVDDGSSIEATLGITPFSYQDDEDVEPKDEGMVDLFEVEAEECEPAIAPDLEPKVELKPLTYHLKYVYLEDGEKKPVIIYAGLEKNEEEQLVKVLKEHKGAIGWSISDIKGISPAVCMHQIDLEPDSNPIREGQRRLNPTLNEVVKKEVIKLRNENIVYPVSDSKWVSLVHVVPKKGGITIVENEKGEKIPTRLTTGW